MDQESAATASILIEEMSHVQMLFQKPVSCEVVLHADACVL